MSHPKRILIADDDEALVDALARRCQALGLVVERAYDGISALRTIAAWEPNLVILDVNMPSGSGLSVCEMIGQDSFLKSIPIIRLTGRSDVETIAACNRLDAVYLPKGPNVWSQLEPLLVDRLKIAQARPAEEKQAEEVQTEEERILDRFVDAILAALGGNHVEGQIGAEKSGEDPVSAGQSSRPCVLCIDDDADFATTLKLRLKQHGVDVFHAFAGMEGYRSAFTHEAQAIILDHEMPDGNGEYILRRLKDNPVTQDIPVIVLTGTNDQALARRMYNLGAARFMTKPVDWNELWAELQLLVHRERLPASLTAAALH